MHHEIYLSDARKVPAEKWKTVIRHPICADEKYGPGSESTRPLLLGTVKGAQKRMQIFVRKGLTKPGGCSIIFERSTERPTKPKRAAEKPRKKCLTSSRVCGKINKLSAERRTGRTLKIEQYRILVTEPLTCIWTLKNSKKVIHRTQAIAC